MAIDHIIVNSKEKGVAFYGVLDQDAPAIYHHERQVVLLKKVVNLTNQTLFT